MNSEINSYLQQGLEHENHDEVSNVIDYYKEGLEKYPTGKGKIQTLKEN